MRIGRVNQKLRGHGAAKKPDFTREGASFPSRLRVRRSQSDKSRIPLAARTIRERVRHDSYEGRADEKAPPSKPEDGAPSHVGFAPIIGRHG
jgi:hypothetical protein